VIRYQYNRQVDPPGPFVHVNIKRLDASGAFATVPALVDSGADKTVVPQSLIEELALAQAGLVEAAGLNQIGVLMPVYVVQIGIRDTSPVVVEVIGALGEQHVLLGRDVLNRHRVTLDGPQLLCIIE